LFVVPAFYLILAPHTRPPDERTRRLDTMEREVAPVDDPTLHEPAPDAAGARA
jgi:hypothetical protein